MTPIYGSRCAASLPGTPLYNEEGGQILKGKRDFDAAKRLLGQSGYSGQPVTLMAAQDIPEHKAWGDVTIDLLNRLGMKVDFVATDWGTVVARRAQRSGWHAYVTGHPGVDCANPATNKAARANGDQALFGWPSNREVEAQVSAWFDATTFDDEKAAVRRMNKAALDHVVYAPLGFFLLHQAWRKNVTGIVPGPLPFFWGVSKTV
jgi:peptide/nickel transport system substrate-binding protein